MRRISPLFLIRAASIFSLLYCLGHMSGYPWTPGSGAAPEQVVAQMQAVRFEAVGEQRTYWEFYVGFGHIISAFLALQAASLWCVAPIARREGRRTIPLLTAFLLAVLVNVLLSYHYFFAVPALFSVAIAVLLAASIGSLWGRATA